ncbi:unnamed protein product [Schistosoma haematobium]|nr:unnamed protein product [Schistosoma haematobium]
MQKIKSIIQDTFYIENNFPLTKSLTLSTKEIRVNGANLYRCLKHHAHYRYAEECTNNYRVKSNGDLGR